MEKTVYRCPFEYEVKGKKLLISVDMDDLHNHVHEIHEAERSFTLATSSGFKQAGSLTVEGIELPIAFSLNVSARKKDFKKLLEKPAKVIQINSQADKDRQLLGKGSAETEQLKAIIKQQQEENSKLMAMMAQFMQTMQAADQADQPVGVPMKPNKSSLPIYDSSGRLIVNR